MIRFARLKTVFTIIVLVIMLFVFFLGPEIGKSEAQVELTEFVDNAYQININKNLSRKNTLVGKLQVNNDFDYRVKVLDEYFVRNNSPLQGYGKNFVEACDKYGAPKDCTLLPAIGYIETRLCTLDLSHQQRNCWGWGGAGENRIIFNDYAKSIDTITKALMELSFYGPEFFVDPVQGQFFYCGAHCNMWGTYVQNSREDINQLAVEMGYAPLF